MMYFIVLGLILALLILLSVLHNYDMKRIRKKLKEIEDKNKGGYDDER